MPITVLFFFNNRKDMLNPIKPADPVIKIFIFLYLKNRLDLL